MDKKGTFIYLAVAFALSFLAVPGLVYAKLLVFEDPGLFNNVTFLIVMWFPALSALAASQLSSVSAPARSALWPIPGGRALRLVAVVMLAMLLINGITSLFGWSSVQWHMGTLTNRVNEVFPQPISEQVEGALPAILLVGSVVFSVLMGATLYAVLALGCEMGWRGYLLPRLLTLGRWKAYAITGVLWGLWILPLLYFSSRFTEGAAWAPGAFALGALGVIVVLTLFGAFLGEVLHRTGSLGLAAICTGCFVTQFGAHGFFSFLFQDLREPWAGPFGMVAIVVWAIVVALAGILIGPESQTKTPQEAGAE